MQPVEVAVDEGIPGLRLVRGAVGETEMPGGVFGPCVLLEVCVLCRCVRLRVAPVAVQDVLSFIDEASSLRHRRWIERVGTHSPRVSDGSCQFGRWVKVIGDIAGGATIDRPCILASEA
jgi:hypothetical protein